MIDHISKKPTFILELGTLGSKSMEGINTLGSCYLARSLHGKNYVDKLQSDSVCTIQRPCSLRHNLPATYALYGGGEMPSLTALSRIASNFEW